MDIEASKYLVENAISTLEAAELGASPAKEEYKRRLADTLGGPCRSRVLAFNACTASSVASAASSSVSSPSGDTSMCDPSLRMLYVANKSHEGPRSTRHVPQSPERILDAPDLLDDYYLNLLDWNSENILGV